MKRIILFLSLMMAFSVPSFARERIPTKKEIDNVDDTEQDGTQVRNFSQIDIDELLPYGEIYSYNLDRDLQEKILEKIEEKTGKNLIFYNGYINDNGGGKRSIYFVELNKSDGLKPNGDPLYYYKDYKEQYVDNNFTGQKKQYEVNISFKGFLHNIFKGYMDLFPIQSFDLYSKGENRKLSNIFNQYFHKYNSNVILIDKGNYFELQYEDGNEYVAKISKEDFIKKLKNEPNIYVEQKYKNGDTKLNEDDVRYINEELVKLCKESLRLKSDDIVYDDGATYFILKDDDENEYPISIDIRDYQKELLPKIDLGIIDDFESIRDNEVFKNHLTNIGFEANTYPNYNVKMEDNGNFYIYFSKYENELTHNYKIQIDFLKKLKDKDIYSWGGVFLNNFKLEIENKNNGDFKFNIIKNIKKDQNGYYTFLNGTKQKNLKIKVYVKYKIINDFKLENHESLNVYIHPNENREKRIVDFARNYAEKLNSNYLYDVNFNVLPDTLVINGNNVTIDLLDSISNEKIKINIHITDITKVKETFKDFDFSIEMQSVFDKIKFKKKEIDGKQKTILYYEEINDENSSSITYFLIPNKIQLYGELDINENEPLSDFKTKLISNFLKEKLLYVNEIVSFNRNLKVDNDGKYFDIVYKDLDNENQNLKVYIDESKWHVLRTLTDSYWLDLPDGKNNYLSDEDIAFVKQFFNEKYLDGANDIEIKNEILTDESGNRYFIISGNDHSMWNDKASDYNIYLNEREKNGPITGKCPPPMFPDGRKFYTRIFIRAMDCYTTPDVLMKYSKKKKDKPEDPTSPSNLPKTTPSNIPKNQTPSTRTSTPPTVTNRTPITIIEPKQNEETKTTESNTIIPKESNEIITNHSPETNGANRISRNIKTGDNFWEILFCSLGVANLLYLLFYKRNKIRE